MLFDPSPQQVRRFFGETLSKHQQSQPLTPIEAMALDWILEHPEYHDALARPDETLGTLASTDDGRENPYLHLSMHLAIAEQLSIDQPPGIRAAFERLAQRHGSLHDAAHDVMECLGETLWRAQRDRAMPDGQAYLTCLLRKAG